MSTASSYGPPIPFPSAPYIDDPEHSLQFGKNINIINPILGKDTKVVTEEIVHELAKQGFTKGLAQSLITNIKLFPLRIWVIDNSGSMYKPDGNRLIPSSVKGTIRVVKCTRWEEIQDTVEYHVRLVGLLETPTSFRLLNDPAIQTGSQIFDVAQMGSSHIDHDIQTAHSIISNTHPVGATPLTDHILEIRSIIQGMHSHLVSEGKRIAIILATDGLPTDQRGRSGDYERKQFVDSLRSLESLPVWLVIRLCTDDKSVVEFYNNLDEQLELSLDVLDDYLGEAQEVSQFNPWINYILPIHRLREMGCYERLWDLLDERALTKSELRDYCTLLFGLENMDGIADPIIDWKKFMKDMQKLLEKEELYWNPVQKKVSPLLNLKKMNKIYGDGGSCGVM